MNLIKNKIFLSVLSSILFLLIISGFLNYWALETNHEYAIKNNKIFTILTEYNKEKGQFLFFTENKLKLANELNNFIPNISFFIFDINQTEESDDLFELPDLVQLGFIEFNDKILNKARYFGHQLYLKLAFSDSIKNNNKLLIDETLSSEENKENLMLIQNVLKKYQANLYLDNIDSLKLENNPSLVDDIIKFNPFTTTKQTHCNEKNKICFLSGETNEKELMIKFQEILNVVKPGEKWFVAIQYNAKNVRAIKQIIDSSNNGILHINRGLLNKILAS